MDDTERLERAQEALGYTFEILNSSPSLCGTHPAPTSV